MIKIAAILLITVGISVSTLAFTNEDPLTRRPAIDTTSWGTPRPTPEDAMAAVGYLRQVEQHNIWDFVATAAAEQQRLAEAARARPRSSGYHPGTTSGACTGFAIPDYIIQRESGGNPSAYNPSGAYGCAQTLLSHYSRGSCQGLDPYNIDGQRACVDILSNGGTNLNPWAATR